MNDKILKIINEIIEEKGNPAVDEISDTTSLKDDLEFDSFAWLYLPPRLKMNLMWIFLRMALSEPLGKFWQNWRRSNDLLCRY